MLRYIFALLSVFFLFVGPLFAQSPVQDVSVPVDYQAWSEFAISVEEDISDRRTTLARLDEMRADVVNWRARFGEVKSKNADRVATARSQLEALGPAPDEGVQEAPEIAARRDELKKQIAELEAPALVADEAATRASGLISEIDALARARQAQALMQLYPTPANPSLWPEAIGVLLGEGKKLGVEVVEAHRTSSSPSAFKSNLPLIAGLMGFALLMLVGAQRWVDLGIYKVQRSFQTRRGRNAFGIFVSTGRVLLPLAGVVALSIALRLTGLVGPSGAVLLENLPYAGAVVFFGIWLATATFPVQNEIFNPLGLGAGDRRQGRYIVILLSLVTGLELLRQKWLVPQISTDEVFSVLSAPLPVIGGLLLWRLGAILKKVGQDQERQDNEEVEEVEASASIFNKLMSGIGRLSRAAGAVSIVLMLIGYVPASLAIVFPMILSIALVFFLLVLILLETDLYDVLMRRPADSGPSLATSLIAFGMVFVSLPLFALIWGVRSTELLEYWRLFSDGFAVGETRIRPGDFLVFLIIFAVGYTATKIVQGVISASVLPKTRIDIGSQKAMLSGLGYIGVFISGLLAFTLAGIDLSSLAIVLGALSVGIGFGLQNIVSNFVSGIILLIERPVSEGDWIEVNGVMGTVRGVSVRSTTIETFDRRDVIVPNADLVSGAVTNWTRFSRSGRLIVKIGVAYGSDTRRIIEMLEKIGNAQDGVSFFPSPPAAFFRGFGDSALNFELRIILKDVSDTLKVETEVHHQIAELFTKEGIEIPFVQRDLWIRNPEALYPPKSVNLEKGNDDEN